DRLVNGNAESDLLLGAADARMPDTNRPRAVDFAEVLHRTVRVRCRPFASELVETVAVPVPFVSVGFGEASGVEVGAPRTLLVNRQAVRKLRAALRVERGQRAVRRVLQ